MQVGPSKRRDEWRAFLTSKHWSPEAFQKLFRSDDVGAASFEVETFIDGAYRGAIRAAQLRQQLGQPDDPTNLESARQRARWISANYAIERRSIGAPLRELDLTLMRWMRRASCLSVVTGAGVTMDAGGPSWPGLVRKLLTRALERGFEVAEMQADPANTAESKSFRRVVKEVKHFEPTAKKRVQEIIAAIDDKKADTEVLMEGVQLVDALKGQHLFTDITEIIYSQVKAPGPIHQALAELAKPQFVSDRNGWFPGWDGFITYNFDDLLGEALDAAHIARAAYAMRGEEIAGDPNEIARRAGQNAPHYAIYHLHGYTPRRPFLITKVQYVFSTAQYKKMYGDARAALVDQVLNRWLMNPVHRALYVGCSFDDEAMNGLLREAAESLPGRYHYALLRWTGDKPFAASTPEDIAIRSAVHELNGIRPIWFDRFDEIPGLIRQLA